MVRHEIIGDDMQAVVLTLGQGDAVRAEAGAMMYMTDGITMDARMDGGLLGGLKRKLLAGESFFITHFRCERPSGRIAFAGPHPGKIIELEGTGLAFIHAGGTVVELALAPSETIKVDTGCLVAFDPAVAYEIARVGGIKTSLFGGEGLFFAAMTGPGRVWLQTLPFSRLADRINQAFKGDRGETKRDMGGLLGGLGNVIGGDR